MSPIPPAQVTYPQALSLRQLRFFVTLARLGSFSRAAEEMSVTQSALSAAIRQAETHLGAQLFTRTTHHVELTEIGRALLLRSQRLLAMADHTFSEMRDIVLRQRASVRVGAIPSLVAFVSQALADLQPKLPQANILLNDGKSDMLAEDVRTGGLDLAICVASSDQSDLTSHLLVEDEMVLVLAHNHRLAGRKQVRWSDLRGEEIVHFLGGGIGTICTAALVQNGLTSSTRFRVDQVDSLYGLVASGLVVGILPQLYTRPGQRGTCLVSLTGPAIRRNIVLLHRENLGGENPLGQTIADQLQGTFKSDYLASLIDTYNLTPGPDTQTVLRY